MFTRTKIGLIISSVFLSRKKRPGRTPGRENIIQRVAPGITGLDL
jgi:hypothetical protein